MSVATLIKEEPKVGLAITDLTPELAARLLAAQHPSQRRTSRTQLAKYERLMRAGRWRDLAPDPILVDGDTGTMFNGAHRCQAVVNTGITIKVYIDWHSDPSLFPVIDRGLRREAAQFVMPNRASIRASASRIMLWHEQLFDRPLGGVNAMFEMDEIVENAKRNEELFTQLMPHAATIYSRTGLSQSVALAALAIAHNMGFGDSAVEFAEDLENPVVLMPSDPAWALFDRMSRVEHRHRRRQIGEDWILLVRALNAKINGESLPAGKIRVTALWPRIAETGKDFHRRSSAAAGRTYRLKKEGK